MQPAHRLTPPRRPRPNSLVMVVAGIESYNSSFLGSMNARRTMNIAGREIRNGVDVGHASIQLTGTRINGVIARGHWLDIPRAAIRPGGLVDRLLNLSTGQEVYTQFRFLDWFH
jgi:hypothetical protein